MKLVEVKHPPTGPQLFLAGQRVHHGLSGACLVLIGTALAIHDRKDVKAWLHPWRWL